MQSIPNSSSLHSTSSSRVGWLKPCIWRVDPSASCQVTCLKCPCWAPSEYREIDDMLEEHTYSYLSIHACLLACGK